MHQTSAPVHEDMHNTPFLQGTSSFTWSFYASFGNLIQSGLFGADSADA
jgi:hypothetical protein